MPHNSMHVIVVYSTQARVVFENVVNLPSMSKVSAALEACATFPSFPVDASSASSEWTLGVWGRPVTTDFVLQEGDRLELYRSLKVDPKVARRERFQKQGTRAAGLFANRRKGAKPGY